jgi:tetratricopeptide (TPR) repeat protein
MAEGLLDSAAASFLRWHASPFAGIVYRWNRGLVEAAAALDRSGNPDSALALYERALALPSISALGYEDYWYPFVLRRLGELHESLGNSNEAIHYYNEFIDLWRDADPELQLQVEGARIALARLVDERS